MAPDFQHPQKQLDERSDEYGRQLLQLHALERRNPLHDATVGRIYESELEQLAAGPNQVAAQLARDMRRRAEDRFNEIHPIAVSVEHENQTTVGA